MKKVRCAIVGSGNIGTDLMIKILRTSQTLDLAVMVGIDADSHGLGTARDLGVSTTHEGVEGLISMPEFKDVKILFDATSAAAHHHNFEKIRAFAGKTMIDLTPAAIGPYLVPVVNFDQLEQTPNVNMITCGGQATIPIVAAISQVAEVYYAEIVASIASKSAGPGTRANIDEFTETTAKGIESVGGAQKGKAIIILNPAEPPIVMRDTVFTLSANVDRQAILDSVHKMVSEVQQYVPGYRLHQEIQFEEVPEERPALIDGLGYRHGLKTTVLLEVKGAGHYLPAYAGNLDIMTSAAMATGEKLAQKVEAV